MGVVSRVLLAMAAALIFPLAGFAQSAQSESPASVPRLINITGGFRPADGQPPAAVETVTLAIYADAEAARRSGRKPKARPSTIAAVTRSCLAPRVAAASRPSCL